VRSDKLSLEKRRGTSPLRSWDAPKERGEGCGMKKVGQKRGRRKRSSHSSDKQHRQRESPVWERPIVSRKVPSKNSPSRPRKRNGSVRKGKSSGRRSRRGANHTRGKRGQGKVLANDWGQANGKLIALQRHVSIKGGVNEVRRANSTDGKPRTRPTGKPFKALLARSNGLTPLGKLGNTSRCGQMRGRAEKGQNHGKNKRDA